MNILLLDNGDSFTRNLEHLLALSIDGCSVCVRTFADLPAMDFAPFDLIVISPGPGTPADYPGYEYVIESGKPVLGICLGMQIINELHGGATGRLVGCVHGKTDQITLAGIEHVVARYHSLHVTQVGHALEVLAENSNGVVMALGNRDRQMLGYQFHPESFLTPDGGAFIDFALDFLGLD